MKAVSTITIELDSIKEGLQLYIDARRKNTLFDAGEEAAENNEARFQLLEGCFYDYAFSDSNFAFALGKEKIIQAHTRNKHSGTISPNIFVGTLLLVVIQNGSDKKFAIVELEVQSVKSSYREEYRDMLEFITEKCTDLLLLSDAPVYHHFETDYLKNAKQDVMYQRFAFINSVIGTEEFSEAIHRIVTAPVTRWTEISERKDIRQSRRFSNSNIKEILNAGKRVEIPISHFLKTYGLDSLPDRINSIKKTDSVDTPENRFIKYALGTFLKFCTDVNFASNKGNKLEKESLLLIKKLEAHLSHSVFRSISNPTTLKLNSPILQRKEGYREVLRVWLMFDLAAKLIWTGGNDIYSGGKKDVATLYEYWIFFKLLELFQSTFSIKPKDISALVKSTPDGLNLIIKQGIFTALQGTYNTRSRNLNVKFSYNRSYSGNSIYPESGSWTTTLRPDYTLSFWPFAISEAEAEKQELIVHIHFDAKYKISNFSKLLEQNSEEQLDVEKTENRSGIYKNADLLKMHAYKDAIRRTGGAYVLYPGEKPINKKGFHEVIPGLGAFPVNPKKIKSGITELKSFIIEVINHFINRASQREKLAFRTYDIFQKPPDSEDEVRELLPETVGLNRSLIPDETYVLVGFYNSAEQYKWITKNRLYNFRTGYKKGSLILDKETVSAKYLLLHTTGDSSSSDLWRITSKGPKVLSKEDLIKKGYASPTQPNYLIIQIEPANESEFEKIQWNFKKLKNYLPGRASGVPFTTTLSEMIKNKQT